MIKKVLVTGAAGLCGSVVSHGLTKLKYKVFSCDIKSSPSPAAKALGIPLSKKISGNRHQRTDQPLLLKLVRGWVW